MNGEKGDKNMSVTFASCGIDPAQNFLQAPLCPCGCGGYAYPVLKAKDDLYGFMYAMLEDHDCNHCAIFAICDDNSVAIGIKAEDGIKIYGSNGDNLQQLIADVQEEFQFHCYGLLEQINAEQYSIIME